MTALIDGDATSLTSWAITLGLLLVGARGTLHLLMQDRREALRPTRSSREPNLTFTLRATRPYDWSKEN